MALAEEEERRSREVSSPWKPANLVLSTDYDFTCIQEESCELLIRAKEEAMGIDDCRLLKAYFQLWDEYQLLLQERMALGESGSLSPPSHDHPSCDDHDHLHDLPFDSKNLRNALKRLAGLELQINRKVMVAGLLKGLTREQIRAAGKRISLQPGCLQVLLRFASLGTAIHVLSANWSRDLVSGGLSPIPDHLLSVHCNDLDFDAEGVSTGWFRNAVTNARDKEKILQSLRKDAGHEKMIVYLGDDQPDALALLDADLGIVMGATHGLCTLLRQHCVELRPLTDAAKLLGSGTVSTFRQSGILFQADDWDDVSACLL